LIVGDVDCDHGEVSGLRKGCGYDSRGGSRRDSDGDGYNGGGEIIIGG